MYLNLSNKITEFLIKNNAVQDDEKEVYIYGLELFLSSIVNFAIILFIGYLFDRFFETIIFLITFCPLRQFSGGFHASNYARCTIYFNLIYIGIIQLEKYLLLHIEQYILLLILVITSLIIALMAPIEDSNKPLNNYEKHLFKSKSIKILIFWNVMVVLEIFIFKVKVLCLIYSVIAVVLLAVLMITGSMKNMKERGN